MNITLLDPIGACCSLLSTYYFTQARTYAFPTMLLSIVVNSILYYQKGIYAHLGLEVIYFISSVYGWYTWSHPNKVKKKPAVLISKIPLFIKIGFILFALMAIPLLAYALGRWTDSNIPYWDATTTILALLAQWMLCKKWIESWSVWFVRDSLVVVLHWVKNIPFHSATHFIYLMMAIVGYVKWRKIMAKQPAAFENTQLKSL